MGDKERSRKGEWEEAEIHGGIKGSARKEARGGIARKGQEGGRETARSLSRAVTAISGDG